MASIWNSISSLWGQIFYAVCHIGFPDIFDILVIAFIVYKIIGFLRETRAGQLVKGIVILLVISLLAKWFNLVSLKWLLTKVFESAIIAVAIIFQPELRRALEKVGRSNFGGLVKGQTVEEERENITACIKSVCTAAGSMQKQKIGALIVFERNTLLGDIVDTGTVIDATATPQMIGNVFYPKSPLHDGALIIRDGRLLAAGCILPLSQNENISLSLGTRHRAAIGMSENSDAVVVVVSEETGTISIAINGSISRNFTPASLNEKLNTELLEDVLQTKENPIRHFANTINPFKKKTDNDSGREEK